MNSCISKLLVILHLPFPVISNFFPNLLFFSKRYTSFLFWLADIAAIIPAGPPPITAIFTFFVLSICLRKSFHLFLYNKLMLALVLIFHIRMLMHLVGMQRKVLLMVHHKIVLLMNLV